MDSTPRRTDRLRVRVHQWASGLDPDDNRARLAEVAPGADLVVLPEAFARDFGQAGSDVSPFAEPVDGPFAREVARVADATSSTVVAGMFEVADDPDPALQHPRRRRRPARRRTARSTSTTPSATASPTA